MELAHRAPAADVETPAGAANFPEAWQQQHSPVHPAGKQKAHMSSPPAPMVGMMHDGQPHRSNAHDGSGSGSAAGGSHWVRRCAFSSRTRSSAPSVCMGPVDVDWASSFCFERAFSPSARRAPETQKSRPISVQDGDMVVGSTLRSLILIKAIESRPKQPRGAAPSLNSARSWRGGTCAPRGALRARAPRARASRATSHGSRVRRFTPLSSCAARGRRPSSALKKRAASAHLGRGRRGAGVRGHDGHGKSNVRPRR